MIKKTTILYTLKEEEEKKINKYKKNNIPNLKRTTIFSLLFCLSLLPLTKNKLFKIKKESLPL